MQLDGHALPQRWWSDHSSYLDVPCRQERWGRAVWGHSVPRGTLSSTGLIPVTPQAHPKVGWPIFEVFLPARAPASHEGHQLLGRPSAPVAPCIVQDHKLPWGSQGDTLSKDQEPIRGRTNLILHLSSAPALGATLRKSLPSPPLCISI